MKVSYNAQQHDIPIELTATVLDLALSFESLFGLSPPRQKIIHRGKRLSDLDATLESLGLTAASKLQLLGTAEADVTALQAYEAALRHRAQVIATRKTGKLSTTRPSNFGSLSSLPTVRFHAVTPLPEDPTTPHFQKRSDLLLRLAKDPAILYIMEKRDLTCGELTELHPLRTDRSLLGLNKNAGQQILLKIMTDDLTGTRSYNAVRRVLVHELTHNIHGPHELPFMQLDSEMAKEVAEQSSKPIAQGNRLGGQIEGEQYDPEEARRVEGQLLQSGQCESVAMESGSAGSRLGGAVPEPLTLEARRREAAEAAERRKGRS